MPETLEHVAFECPLYDVPRARPPIQEALAAYPDFLKGPLETHPTAQAHHAALGHFFAESRERREVHLAATWGSPCPAFTSYLGFH